MSDNTWEKLKEKGNEEFKKGNYNAAVNLYSDALQLNQSQEALYTNRALCFINLNRVRNAVYDLNKALEINPKSIKALRRLANIRVLTGELGEALMILEKCVCIEPKVHEHLVELGVVQNMIKNMEEINKIKQSTNIDYIKLEELSKNLLEKCKEFTSLKMIYINALLNNCKPADALAYLTQKLSLEEKQNEEFEYLTALALYYDGKVENAKKLLNMLSYKSMDSQQFRKLLNIIKETETEKEKANELFKKGDYDEAINMYTKILEIDPNNKIFNSTIHANKALCLQKKNKTLDALKDINKAIELNPNYTKAYLRRGNIQMSLKNFEEARYDFQRVKDLDPTNTEAAKLIEEAKREEKNAKRKDYYKILDIPKGSSEAEIKKAYRKMAAKWHPDKNSESEEHKKEAEKMFKDINEAYSVLSDPKKKQMFDNGIYPDEEGYGDGGFSGSNINPEEIFSMFFGGGGFGGSSGGFGGSSRSGSGPRIVFNFGGNEGFSSSSGRSNRGHGHPFSSFFN